MIKNTVNPTKIIFGEGKFKSMFSLIKNKKVLIICTKRGKTFFINELKKYKIKKNIFWIDDVKSNPSLQYLEKINTKSRNRKFDIIIGYGGGSVLDTSKVISLMFSLNKKYKINYIIENINNLTKNFKNNLIAIPTTAGTGSEVTPYATVWDTLKKKKLSLNHKKLFPKLALVDPELTYHLPSEPTQNSGLDALNQSFESLWNKNYDFKVSIIAYRAINLSLKGLHMISENLNNKKARYNLSKASLLAGLCISKTRTSICHSISYPLTAYFKIPHGLACAFTMLAVMEYIDKKNKNFFNKINKFLNLKSNKELIQKISGIFEKLEVKNKNKNLIGNFRNIMQLINQMQTPGRSDNFILPINDKFIKSILRKSYY
tara:strand:- start:228 stop:1349 length:1122 start_codon:yes stop_codon:yes gene_type:complete